MGGDGNYNSSIVKIEQEGKLAQRVTIAYGGIFYTVIASILPICPSIHDRNGRVLFFKGVDFGFWNGAFKLFKITFMTRDEAATFVYVYKAFMDDATLRPKPHKMITVDLLDDGGTVKEEETVSKNLSSLGEDDSGDGLSDSEFNSRSRCESEDDDNDDDDDDDNDDDNDDDDDDDDDYFFQLASTQNLP